MKQNALTREYEKLESKGLTTSLRPTITVKINREIFHFYDMGCQAFEDPEGLLPDFKEGDSKDYGFKTEDYLGEMWHKNFMTSSEPRWIETLIQMFGKENVEVSEWGKYGRATATYWKGNPQEYTLVAKDEVLRLLS